MNPNAHLLLIGGGHAHCGVVADFIARGLPCERVTLLTPDPHLRYSGMVPGWIAGHYSKQDGLVDLHALAQAAGVRLVLDHCVGLDLKANAAVTRQHGTIPFDCASINSGGVGRGKRVLGDDPRLLDVRPIAGFVEHLEQMQPLGHIAVIGGGAGGVEIAFALRNVSNPKNTKTETRVALVTGKAGLLPDFASPVRKRVARALERQGIRVISGDAAIEAGALCVNGLPIESVDHIITALGSGAPDWPAQSGLATDQAGFIAISSQFQSRSHPHIFAVGDIAARQDRSLAHSGVHAVMAAPALAANLRAALQGQTPRKHYSPRPASLYLISTGDGRAIGSYGPLAFEGRWVARLKHRIDTAWIAGNAKRGRNR